MKVSGFTFLRNAEMLHYPYLQSIESILPICDEFIIALGESDDGTAQALTKLGEKYPKIRIIDTCWNEHMQTKGYTYGQQKMIAQFACTGDWLFYLEGDELVHEKDLSDIKQAMIDHQDDPRVEVLAFKYYHFYGNTNTYVDSPGWYRYAPRIIKAKVRSYAPDGLYWLVLDNKRSNRKGRYPYAKVLDCFIYHYGWVRSEKSMQEKSRQVSTYWGKTAPTDLTYSNVDSTILSLFSDSHPALIDDFFPKEKGLYCANPNHTLTSREKRQRLKKTFGRIFGLDLSRRHFKQVDG